PNSISLAITNMGRLVGLALRHHQTFSIILRNDHDDLLLASNMLQRIGFNNIVGYLKNGLEQWIASGRETGCIEDLYLEQFGSKQTRREVKVIDVREPHEFDEEHIEDSLSIPLTRLEENAKNLKIDGPITTFCHSGYRSTTAASILKRQGFDNITVSLDGMKVWKSHDFPLETE
ncbi:MAG: rhodanese-like domain-containing protein, partial [Candidatus Thorarchaeota archaeon]